jgi:putative transposase
MLSLSPALSAATTHTANSVLLRIDPPSRLIHPAPMYRRSYRRNLPHFHPPGAALFLTWRLFGSIPKERIAEIELARLISEREEFRTVESILDSDSHADARLRDPSVARMICECIEMGASSFQRYALHEYVVMPNHVHLFATPFVDVPVITRSLKGVTANFANKILGTTGKPFWQDECFDRWSRDENEFQKTRAYIVRNPVKARLAARPEDCPWSSASRRIALSK